MEGLPESNNEDIRATIDELLNDIGCNFTVDWCDSVYRMGVRSEGNKRGRPIKVVFPYLRYKHLFFKNLYKLKDMPEWKGTYVNDDLTPVKQAERNEMRAVFSYAKSKNIDCQLRGAKLIVDKRRYTYADMKNLPLGLSIEAAKMIPVEDGLAFQSKHAPLSNLHPCKIRHKENDFTPVEQGLQHEHAVTCKRDDIATKIMSTNDPEKIMQLARGLPDSGEWNGKEVEVCTDLNKKKHKQNKRIC